MQHYCLLLNPVRHDISYIIETTNNHHSGGAEVLHNY